MEQVHRVAADVSPQVEQLVSELRDEPAGALNLPNAVLSGPARARAGEERTRGVLAEQGGAGRGL